MFVPMSQQTEYLVMREKMYVALIELYKDSDSTEFMGELRLALAKIQSILDR